MSKAKALSDLMRLGHGVMLALGVLVGAVIALRALPPWDVYALTFVTALFLEASTFALNDYFDYDVDVKNKRLDRPLVRGDAIKGEALALFAILFPLGIVCSYFVNWTCFLLALATGLLGVFYDAALKRLKPLGNLYIAYAMAVPFVFGSASVLEAQKLDLNLSGGIVIVAAIAFIAGAGREMMKDAQDVEGDRASRTVSYATLGGVRLACAIAATLYVVAVGLSLLPFLSASYEFYHMNYLYLLPVLVTDALLLFSATSLATSAKPDLKLHRNLTLAALLIGLFAFLLGAYTG